MAEDKAHNRNTARIQKRLNELEAVLAAGMTAEASLAVLEEKMQLTIELQTAEDEHKAAVQVWCFVLCFAVLCCVGLCVVVLCCVVLCCVVLCCVVLCQRRCYQKAKAGTSTHGYR